MFVFALEQGVLVPTTYQLKQIDWAIKPSETFVFHTFFSALAHYKLRALDITFYTCVVSQSSPYFIQLQKG